MISFEVRRREIEGSRKGRKTTSKEQVCSQAEVDILVSSQRAASDWGREFPNISRRF
jgi:hypothetical protein